MPKWVEPTQSRDQLVLFPQRLDDVLPGDHPVRLFDDLIASGVRDMGVHVLECSGNGPPTFGLMSAGRWGGVLVSDVLDALEITSSSRGLVPYSMYIALPSFEGDTWVGHFDFVV